MSVGDFQVICLCADWCGVCREYRPGFEGLAQEFSGVKFNWLDIEAEAEAMGDLDIENFPTLLIRRAESIVFFGTMLPHLGHLRRAIESFQEQTPEQSRAYARSSPERLGWQTDPDLRGLCGISAHA
jgi:thioredoxin 1